jgi:hypothetical protein
LPRCTNVALAWSSHQRLWRSGEVYGSHQLYAGGRLLRARLSSLPCTRRDGRASSSLTASGGGLPIGGIFCRIDRWQQVSGQSTIWSTLAPASPPFLTSEAFSGGSTRPLQAGGEHRWAPPLRSNGAWLVRAHALLSWPYRTDGAITPHLSYLIGRQCFCVLLCTVVVSSLTW